LKSGPGGNFSASFSCFGICRPRPASYYAGAVFLLQRDTLNAAGRIGGGISMKKFTNEIDDILSESLRGFGAAHGDIVAMRQGGLDLRRRVRS
jgi:hypothetical protein